MQKLIFLVIFSLCLNVCSFSSETDELHQEKYLQDNKDTIKEAVKDALEESIEQFSNYVYDGADITIQEVSTEDVGIPGLVKSWKTTSVVLDDFAKPVINDIEVDLSRRRIKATLKSDIIQIKVRNTDEDGILKYGPQNYFIAKYFDVLFTLYATLNDGPILQYSSVDVGADPMSTGVFVYQQFHMRPVFIQLEGNKFTHQLLQQIFSDLPKIVQIVSNRDFQYKHVRFWKTSEGTTTTKPEASTTNLPSESGYLEEDNKDLFGLELVSPENETDEPLESVDSQNHYNSQFDNQFTTTQPEVISNTGSASSNLGDDSNVGWELVSTENKVDPLESSGLDGYNNPYDSQFTTQQPEVISNTDPTSGYFEEHNTGPFDLESISTENTISDVKEYNPLFDMEFTTIQPEVIIDPEPSGFLEEHHNLVLTSTPNIAEGDVEPFTSTSRPSHFNSFGTTQQSIFEDLAFGTFDSTDISEDSYMEEHQISPYKNVSTEPTTEQNIDTDNGSQPSAAFYSDFYTATLRNIFENLETKEVPGLEYSFTSVFQFSIIPGKIYFNKGRLEGLESISVTVKDPIHHNEQEMETTFIIDDTKLLYSVIVTYQNRGQDTGSATIEISGLSGSFKIDKTKVRNLKIDTNRNINIQYDGFRFSQSAKLVNDNFQQRLKDHFTTTVTNVITEGIMLLENDL